MELIKFYRKQMKLTQAKLAEKVGTTHDTISLWELGKSKPDYDALQKLCIIFDISGDELLDIETIKKRNQINVNHSFNSCNVNGSNNKITLKKNFKIKTR